MKIKELHLRNIASIESADIDFESNLVDRLSGTPASVFLISGDTGSGKSVILDGISMALYKDTPRLASISNPKGNKFTDAKGESVSVNSIEQYSRMGISVNDDCYSEVLFEGNDGKEYRARLSLGILKGKKGKGMEEAPIKYRNPKWQVKVGSEDWIDVDKRTGQPILDAVGITFEQFGRMAMLAQGQFATFLTGEKKEREVILEQLTNTEHFSVYGEAIASIYKRAEKDHDLAKRIYDSEKGHMLSLEELERLKGELDARQKEKTDLDIRIEREETKLKLVDTVNAEILKKTAALQEKESLSQEMEKKDYKDALDFVKEWNETIDVRPKFNELRKINGNLAFAESKLSEYRHKFDLLAADRRWRKTNLQKLMNEKEQLEEWLDTRAERSEMYHNESSVSRTIKIYREKQISASETLSKCNELAEVTPALEKAFDEAEKAYSEAKRDVENKQKEIDELIEHRNRLKPNESRKQSEELAAHRSKLEKLSEQIKSLEESRIELCTLDEEIHKDEIRFNELKRISEEKSQAYESAKRQFEETSGLYDAMHTSVGKLLTGLRQDLISHHADVCPLCHQTIDHSLLHDDFDSVLHPLQVERDSKKAEREKTESEKNEASRVLNEFKGKLDIKKASHAKSAINEGMQDKKIKEVAGSLLLDVAGSLPEQIKDKITDIDQQLVKLNGILSAAEGLNQKIDDVNKVKSDLEGTRSEKEGTRNKAKENLDRNTDEIQKQNTALEQLQKDIRESEQTISEDIAAFYPLWKKDPLKTSLEIKQLAEEFLKREQSVQAIRAKLDSATKELENIENYFMSIHNGHSDWTSTIIPAECSCNDILKEWHIFNDVLISLDTTISDNQKKQKECTAILEHYYSKSGKTENNLECLIRGDFEKQNNIVEKMKAKVDANILEIQDIEKRIQEAMQQLGISDPADLPDRAALAGCNNELKEQRDTILAKVGEINSKLVTNNENEKKIQEARGSLSKAEELLRKWEAIHRHFGGTRFRTLVQTYILRPLLNNANIYLERITDRYKLTCSEENEQLSILVHDRYNKDQIRSIALLSGGERFMISLALSLALSSLNRPDLNVNILFIDEGFGTLDERSLDSVMGTLERLQEIAGQGERRVGIISHRPELEERIPVQIKIKKMGEGRSVVKVQNI